MSKDSETQSRESLTEQFSSLRDKPVGTLFYMLGNVEDTKDAVQEAFLKCWRQPECLATVRNQRARIFQVAAHQA